MSERWALPEGTLLGAAAILALAVCLGLMTNHYSTHSVPLFASEQALAQPAMTQVRYLSIQEAYLLLGKPGVLFVDGREAAPYQAGQLSGALSLPVSELAQRHPGVETALARATTVVCYCDAPNCPDAGKLVDSLVGKATAQVALMFEGWEGWQKAGYPAQASPPVGRHP